MILLRERDAPAADPCAFEVFLVKRHHASGFMGGAYVFPGGKLDEADCDESMTAGIAAGVVARSAERLEPTPGRDLDRRTALGLVIAGCRETFEEAGVLLAVAADGVPFRPDAAVRARLDEARQALNNGQTRFDEILAGEDLRLDIGGLHYWDHWVTPSFEAKQFDARFFLARLPPGQEPVFDHHETTAQIWQPPRQTIEAFEAGDVFLAPPTYCVLDELSTFTTIDEAFAAADARSIAAIQPKVALVDGKISVLLPWDEAYPGADGQSLPGAPTADHPRAGSVKRIVMDAERWLVRRST